MNKTRIRLAGAVVATALLTGCKTWPGAWPAAETKAGGTKPKHEAAQVADPRKGTGRSPIEATGIDPAAREIERSLGAR